jgi:hypothetical protein
MPPGKGQVLMLAYPLKLFLLVEQPFNPIELQAGIDHRKT